MHKEAPDSLDYIKVKGSEFDPRFLLLKNATFANANSIQTHFEDMELLYSAGLVQGLSRGFETNRKSDLPHSKVVSHHHSSTTTTLEFDNFNSTEYHSHSHSSVKKEEKSLDSLALAFQYSPLGCGVGVGEGVGEGEGEGEGEDTKEGISIETVRDDDNNDLAIPKNKTSISSHLKTHEKKKFECTKCKACFSRNHDLKRHELIHNKIKAFVCEGCDRGFSRRDALKRHQDTMKKRVSGGCILMAEVTDDLNLASTAIDTSSSNATL